MALGLTAKRESVVSDSECGNEGKEGGGGNGGVRESWDSEFKDDESAVRVGCEGFYHFNQGWGAVVLPSGSPPYTPSQPAREIGVTDIWERALKECGHSRLVHRDIPGEEMESVVGDSIWQEPNLPGLGHRGCNIPDSLDMED